MPSSSASPSTAISDSARELRTKLLWLSVFRVVATTLLLGAIALRLFQGRASELSSEDSLSFLVIGVVYAMTLVYAFWLRQGRSGRTVALVQLSGDVLLATALVYLTGGIESPFTFTYLLAVVAGAIVLYEDGALITAAASSAAYVALALAIQQGWILRPLGAGHLTAERAGFAIVSTVLAQVLIAALSGYLSRQLRAAGGRLSERESDLRVLAAFQREILASMPSGLITSSAAGVVTFINPAGEQILGQEMSSARGLKLEELFPGISTLPRTRRDQLEVATTQGPKLLGLTVAELESDTKGALLVVFQDLTELRRMEDAFKQADRLAAVGRLAAQLAHEIRNPLAAMRGSAQMLAGNANGEVAPRLAQILMRESDRLSNLLEDFLRFARPPPPTLQRCPLLALVEETLEVLQADPLIRGSQVEVGLEPVEASADSDQLRQVLINLLRNALVAAGRHGRVRVTTTGAGERARLCVWDSAGSIPPATLHRIFEPFHSTHPGGTGLGLSICFSIVKAHQGNLWVTSTPETGTEFVVDLPRYVEVGVAHPDRR